MASDWIEWGAALSAQQLMQSAVLQFYVFMLVLVRMSGLMTTAPGLGNPNIPINVRILLTLTLALLVTPSLPRGTNAVFQELDSDRNGILSEDEVPAVLATEFAHAHRTLGLPEEVGLTEREFRLGLEIPSSLLDFAWVAIGEFSLGLLLGIGTMAILSGLQLGGQLIDQQTGLSLGEVFNPELDSSSSLTGDLFYMFGVVIFFVIGGHVLMLTTMVETFRVLPPGHAFASVSTIELFSQLISRSLVIALQVSAPMLATMSIVALAMGYLGHTVPQINILVVGFPIRVIVGLFVLAIAMTGVAEQLAHTLPDTIDALGESFRAPAA